MNTAHFISVVVAAVILIWGAIRGLKGARQVDWQRFLRGPQNISAVRASFSGVLSLVGSFMIFGVIQMAHEGGITPILLGAAYIAAIPLLISINRRLSDAGAAGGVDQLITERFGPITNACFWSAQLLAFFGVLAGQFVAVRSYLEVFHGVENVILALVLGALAPVIYTTVSGFFGVVKNDLVQAIFEIAFLVLVAVPMFFPALFGVTSTVKLFPTGSMFGSYGPLFAIAGTVFLIPTLAVRMDIWQRVNTARTDVRTHVIVWTLGIVAFYYVMLTLVGWSVPPMAAGTAETAVFPRIVQAYVTNPVLLGLLMGSILSALVSSIDSYLVICAIGLIRVVAKTEWEAELVRHEAVPGRYLLRIARGATLLVAAVSGLVAYAWPNLTDLLVASFSAIGVCAPAMLVAVYGQARRSDILGAASILVGLAVWLVGLPFLGKSAFVAGIGVSLLMLFPILRSTAKPQTDGRA